jgi:putative transcriptional regulator
MNGLANRLRDLREAPPKQTQADLADALDVSRQTIIALESGRYAPSLLLALKIAAHFGRPVEEIFWIAPDGS